ncbi:hypothetical protein QBC37DRAFT_422109 [Rhypophila decipiens]|uniref:Uncharacterized protein n=1 Tax=Rhypophila decipiens TaxID=261697 RepID=A0AAN6Y7F7_9PEZI|nr:hypothetical protein QBC37DRAFT_422109 [Rhypophila decipiens]
MAHPGSRRSSQAGLPTSRTTGPASKQPPVKDPKPPEKIPMLESTLTATFVPLPPDLDITKDTGNLPRNRIERLEHIIATIDNQGLMVKENIIWLLDQEKERMILEAREYEQETKPAPVKGGLPASEVDVVIKSLSAKADPGRDYNMKDVPTPNRHRQLPPNLSPRELVVGHLRTLIENGTGDLNGYNNHISGIRKYYADLLMKEMANLELVGMRPEDRLKAAEASM